MEPPDDRHIGATGRAVNGIANQPPSLPCGLFVRRRSDGSQELRDASVPTSPAAHAAGRQRPPDCGGASDGPAQAAQLRELAHEQGGGLRPSRRCPRTRPSPRRWAGSGAQPARSQAWRSTARASWSGPRRGSRAWRSMRRSSASTALPAATRRCGACWPTSGATIPARRRAGRRNRR
jgi:hypothetical protein